MVVALENLSHCPASPARIAAHKKARCSPRLARSLARALLCSTVPSVLRRSLLLQLRLMKLSVQDVYRWGLPACGPFTTTAAELVTSALHLYFYLANCFRFVQPRNTICSTLQHGAAALSIVIVVDVVIVVVVIVIVIVVLLFVTALSPLFVVSTVLTLR